MHNDNLLRRLCAEISAEQDPEKMDEMLSLLQALVQDDLDEIRTRMAFLRKKYAMIFDKRETQ